MSSHSREPCKASRPPSGLLDICTFSPSTTYMTEVPAFCQWPSNSEVFIFFTAAGAGGMITAFGSNVPLPFK